MTLIEKAQAIRPGLLFTPHDFEDHLEGKV